MFYEFQNTVVTNLGGDWESYRVFTAPINWRLESGDRVEFNVVPVGERLTMPAGSASKRLVSGQVSWWFGGFHGGHLHQVTLTGTWHPSPLVAFDFSGERNAGTLPAGRIAQTLLGIRGRLDVSSDLQVSSFVQYDTESGSIGTNSRLRWTFSPGGDLFVIYNHNIRDLTDRWQLDSNQLLIKLQYSLRY